MTERTASGWKREAVFVATADSDLVATLRGHPPGRYRIEWRDRRRQVARVETWVVDAVGTVGRVRALKRARSRKLPLPRYVAPHSHPAAVHSAPVDPSPRPVLPAKPRPGRHR